MKVHYRDPLPAGYLMRYAPAGRGGFSWPTNIVRCEGYTSRGEAVACGEILKTQTGNPATRCEKCRKEHKREWFRLRNPRRRKATV